MLAATDVSRGGFFIPARFLPLGVYLHGKYGLNTVNVR
jgi:hypothetical protein